MWIPYTFIPRTRLFGLAEYHSFHSNEAEKEIEGTNYAPSNDRLLNKDALIRDTNASFQREVEQQVLKSLRDKSSASDGNLKRKLINWSILNSGKQTIIVLWWIKIKARISWSDIYIHKFYIHKLFWTFLSFIKCH